MTRMTGPDCAVMGNFINIHTYAYIHTYIHTYSHPWRNHNLVRLFCFSLALPMFGQLFLFLHPRGHKPTALFKYCAISGPRVKCGSVPREAHTNLSIVSCKGSTRSELHGGLLALCRQTLGSERHRYAIA